MKTYISTIGFDISQIISLIVKFGIEGGDRFVLIRPEEETDPRAQNTLNEIQNFAKQISGNIKIEVLHVPHKDFETTVLRLMELIRSSEGEIIANISGGPREILVPFVVSCLLNSDKVKKTVNFSDIDRVAREITFPKIFNFPQEKIQSILVDISQNEPTTITDIAQRNDLSESTISRFISRLASIGAVHVSQKGKVKEIRLSFTGRVLIILNFPSISSIATR